MIDIPATLKDLEWFKEKPAEPEQIQKLISRAKISLPEEYLNYLLFSDGGHGKLGIEPGWFHLESAEEVINFNKGYEIDKYLPGYFGFGSNGAGEILAFEIKQDRPWRIVMIPFIPMEAEYAVVIANNLEEFILAIGNDRK